jgi:hypothetical protein
MKRHALPGWTGPCVDPSQTRYCPQHYISNIMVVEGAADAWRWPHKERGHSTLIPISGAYARYRGKWFLFRLPGCHQRACPRASSKVDLLVLSSWPLLPLQPQRTDASSCMIQLLSFLP